MRILVIDIETRPTLAYVWRPYKENVSPDQVVDPGGVLSFAAKWYGEKGIEFHADWTKEGKATAKGHEAMIQRSWQLLDKADAVLHFNGKKFDIPHLQREYMQHGLTPPSPTKQIDLLETVKKQARFFMNRLAHVAPQLGLKGKIEHEGFPLWVKCMEGDMAAWKRMERYNKRDVTELEDLYKAVQPWITAHPSYAAFTGMHVCPKCGSDDLKKNGFSYTAQTKFQQYRCRSCGGYSRKTVEGERVHITQVA